MPRFKEHFVQGAVVAGGRRLISELKSNSSVGLGELIFKVVKSAATGGVGACGPDFLEPAENAHHRKFFHSYAAAGALGVSREKVKSADIDPQLKEILDDLGIGYLVHLGADAITPKGLPMTGIKL